MPWRPVLICTVVFLLFTGWLFSDDLHNPDLSSTVRNLQQTLQQLQKQIDDLKATVKELSRKQKKEKQPRDVDSKAISGTAAAAALQQAQENYARARQAEDQKAYNVAIEAYTQAIELDPQNDSAFLRRGYCYTQIGDHAKAVADLNRSLALQPNNSRA